MTKVKKIKVFQYARLQACITGFTGLIIGILYAGIGAIYDIQTNALGSGTALALLAIPIMPLYFMVLGFLGGILGVPLFNLTSKWFGGININIKK